MKNLCLFLLALCTYATGAHAQMIYKFAGDTVGAGTLTGSFSGDGGLAISAGLDRPAGIAVDASGNVYIAEYGNNRVRKVNALTGDITTVVGNGTAAFAGDGGPAAAASIHNPYHIVFDDLGNLYVDDGGNHVIRKVDTSGIIHTVAGVGGSWGYNGDGIAATAAQLNLPTDVKVDHYGNIYIADAGNRRIRKVDAAGVITTIAGNGIMGTTGDGGPATAAEVDPNTVAIGPAGEVYIAENGSFIIRKVDTAGIIHTICGIGTNGHTGDGGPATAAAIRGAMGMIIDDAGDLYFSEWGYNIRVIDTDGTISTIAGTSTYGYSGNGGPATSAKMNEPRGIALDGAGNLYEGEFLNHVVRKISAGPLFTRLNANAGGMLVYPDPADVSFTVELPGATGNYTISVLDMSGKVNQMRSVNVKDHVKETFAVGGFAPGHYIVKVEGANHVFSKVFFVR